MKKLTRIITVLLALTVLSVGQVFAFPISDGDTISLQLSFTNVNGAFKVSDGNGAQILNADGTPFLTFCVEETVYFAPGQKYTANINNAIVKQNGSTEALHDGTKYLYWNFVQGTLDNFSLNSSDVDALQKAIWALQAAANANPVTHLSGKAADLYQLALGKAGEGAELNVAVMNLWNGNVAAQSQLIAGPAPVPEPGTLLLLGSGLAGLALYRRKLKKQ